MQNNKLRKRHFHSSFYTNKEKEKWVVFIDEESKIALAIIGPDNSNLNLVISDNGELANSINTIQKIVIPPKGEIEYSVLFILYPLNHELMPYLQRYF